MNRCLTRFDPVRRPRSDPVCQIPLVFPPRWTVIIGMARIPIEQRMSTRALSLRFHVNAYFNDAAFYAQAHVFDRDAYGNGIP